MRAQKCVCRVSDVTWLFGFVQDPNQRSIMEMFQRSFNADDDMDEAILLEAANEWEDSPPENSSGKHHGMVEQSPSKRSIKDYFSRWLRNFPCWHFILMSLCFAHWNKPQFLVFQPIMTDMNVLIHAAVFLINVKITPFFLRKTENK